MNLRQGAEVICAKAQDIAEGCPVCGTVNIGVLDRCNRLSLARVSRGKKRIEVINRGKVSGHQQFITAPERVIRMPHIHRVWPEIMERHHSLQRRRERGRNAGIAHIGKMAFAVYRQRMNLSMESVTYRSRSPRKIDQHCARINVIHSEPVRSKPCLDCVDVPRSCAESLSKLLRGKPVVVL